MSCVADVSVWAFSRRRPHVRARTQIMGFNSWSCEVKKLEVDYAVQVHGTERSAHRWGGTAEWQPIQTIPPRAHPPTCPG